MDEEDEFENKEKDEIMVKDKCSPRWLLPYESPKEAITKKTIMEALTQQLEEEFKSPTKEVTVENMDYTNKDEDEKSPYAPTDEYICSPGKQ